MYFNWWSVLYILIGLINGVIVSFGIYLILIAKSIKPKKLNIEFNDISKDKVKLLVDNKIKKFKLLDRENINIINNLKECSKELIIEIASLYYPKSKHPCFELNVSEILLLNANVTTRLENLFNKPVVSLLRNTKASHIMYAYDVKEYLDNNKVYKNGVNVIGKGLKIKKVLSIFNPKSYISLISYKFFSLSSKYLAMTSLCFVGEEAYKIYSKKIFNKEQDIDVGSNELIKELQKLVVNDLKDYINNKKEEVIK